MLVLGLDIATSTGLCWVDRFAQPRDWICTCVQAEGANSEEKADDLAGALLDLLRERRPDFAAIEMPQRNVKQFKRKAAGDDDAGSEATINPNALQLSGLAGAAVAILRTLNVPWGLIAPATWRASYLGKGIKPSGAEDWKDLAVRQAQLLRVPLPATKKAQRDTAEAIGIGFSWERCTFIPTRHQQAFMALRMGNPRNTEVA